MKVVLASNNQGKLKEIQSIVSGLDIQFIPQSEFNVSDVEETGLSFIENAILKARHASSMTDLPALADDSGIEVDYLNGAPGIYSARFAGSERDDQKNIDKLLIELKGVSESERKARYQSVMAFVRHARDPTPIIFQGTWEGRILCEAKGNQGFGYDPVFYVEEYDCSAAELDPKIKNEISHRGKALQKMLAYFDAN